MLEETFARVSALLDGTVAVCLGPLALWILLSGLDDLAVLLTFLFRRARHPFPNAPRAPAAATERRTAIFVPCWNEDAVIADMVGHNISAIRYRNYDFFIGAYPNDDPTVEAVRNLEQRFTNVHLCLCPHDGPTSKADCLNWIYQRMLLLEEGAGTRFELVVTHDAEDLIHADELWWMNRLARDYGMIQTPVLPLPTPFLDITHGLYCDDFAECHTKDLVARQAMGGFVPSSGVGTGYTRDALEKLAAAEANRIFEPACLTEDYENGLRLHHLGCRQIFLPLRFRDGIPVATREYFPRTFRQAVRQRTRWVTGIALQTWRSHGWRGGLRQRYWLWRDRKGVVGNPVSLLANLICLYGAATWIAAHAAGQPWVLAGPLRAPWLMAVLSVNFVLQLVHLTARASCAARIYGLAFALGTPLRTVYGNLLNSVAGCKAVRTFVWAWIRREPLVWVKTEHAYPSRSALLPHKRSLEEILVGSEYLRPDELKQARKTKPAGVRLSEHLVQTGLLSENDLYEALSLQLGLALGRIEPHEVRRRVARSLPASVIREWNVLPVKIERGNLHVASSNLPTDELHAVLRSFTNLEIRVQLVTPANFRRLAEELL